MGYRNKTYVVLDYDTDHLSYNVMRMWKEHDKIDFDFHNAHDLNCLRDGSSEETIKGKLRERMNNSKQVIVLVGERTKYNHKYVRWEQELAIKQDLPIIAVNLNKANGLTDLTPPILKENAWFVSVPFEMKKIKHALDKFPDQYANTRKMGPDHLSYDWSKISL